MDPVTIARLRGSVLDRDGMEAVESSTFALKGLVDRHVVCVEVGDLPLVAFSRRKMWATRRVYGSTGTPLTEFAMCSKPTMYARSSLTPAATSSKR